MGNSCSSSRQFSSSVRPEPHPSSSGDVVVGTVPSGAVQRVAPDPLTDSSTSTLVFYEKASQDVVNNNLVAMCKQGKISNVKEMLEKKYDVNMKGMWENTPLISSCQYGHEDIALLLLDVHGVDVNHVNCKGGTALTYACLEGMTQCVKKMLKQGAKVDIPEAVLYNCKTDRNDFIAPLSAAIINGHMNILTDLLEGSSISYIFQQYSSSSAQGNPKTVVKDVTALMLAAKYSNIAMIEHIWRAYGCSNAHAVDSEGSTVLHYACRNKEAEATMTLLDKLEVLEESLIKVADNKGDTPIHISCEAKNVEVVRLLLKSLSTEDRSVQIEDIGKFPCGFYTSAVTIQSLWRGMMLRKMMKVPNKKIVALPSRDDVKSRNFSRSKEHLLRYQNLMGKTPLHIAVKRRSFEIVDILLTHGSDPNVKDSSGLSPRDLALKLPKNSPILPRIESCVEKSGADKKEVEEEKKELEAAISSSVNAEVEESEEESNDVKVAMKNDEDVTIPPLIQTDAFSPPAKEERPQTPSESSLKSTPPPSAPMKSFCQKPKTGLLVAPPSRQDLLSAKRRTVTSNAADSLPISSARDEHGPETDAPVSHIPYLSSTVSERNISSPDNNKDKAENDDQQGDNEVTAFEYSTPSKCDGPIVSPEPTSTDLSHFSKEIVSAPKKQRSMKFSSRPNSTVLQPPDELLTTRFQFRDDQ